MTKRWRPWGVSAAVLAALLGLILVPAAAASPPRTTATTSVPKAKANPNPPAAAPQSALITISPATQTQAAGAPQTYNLAVSCQGTGGSPCGPNTTITIPLDTSVTPPMTDPSWTYAATTGSAGLLTGPPTVVGDNLVLTINDATFISGFSGSIRLTATPPNNITPNNTAWTMTPTLTAGNIAAVTVPTPARSVATALPKPVVTKTTADGGSVYEAGSPITYNISASCSGGSTGNLYLDSGRLVDQLPPGVTYASSTNGGVYDASSNTVTWSFPDGGSTPAGCAAGSTGSNAYQVTVMAPTPAPPAAEQPLVNKATFSGTGPDATDPAGITKSTSAQVPVHVVDTPSRGPGVGYATISKTSLAPIPQAGVSGNQYVGTYPGDWLPASATPSYTVGAAAGSFRVNVNYALVGSYQTDLVDPMPCLDDVTGNVYTSASYDAAPCAHPAFHPTVINVSSAGFSGATGLAAAYASGWRPLAVLTDGTPVPLTAAGAVGSSGYFAIPTPDVGNVATIELPTNAALVDAALQLTIWGYADASLASAHSGLNQLTNIATAIPNLDHTPLTAIQDQASIFTLPQQAQLGISKSFGALGGGPNGTTVLNIKGSVTFPTLPLTHDVVLTDLLPSGLTWANAVTSGQFTINQGAGAQSSSVTATVADIPDFAGSGRELLRMTIPAAAFTTAGSWTISPPANFLQLKTPTQLGLYANTDQIFLYGLGTAQINSTCTTPTQTTGGTTSAVFETEDSMNLAGDGNSSEDHCQNSASLLVKGTGAAFQLTKTVQGNLDTVPKGALGIGDASSGGSGTGSYVLSWSNVGSDSLNNAVIYDILPFVGDTGVSQGQAGTARGSQFAPTFIAVGAVPAGVTVQYSESTNPCRPQVYPDAVNARCVNDWSSVEPADPAEVKALRFESATTYAAGAGFSVSFSVGVPKGIINEVAWNSAATNAADVSDPSTVPLPAEPPKVGLVAPSQPLLRTTTSEASAGVYSSLTDDVSITDAGAPGTISWALLGPVTPGVGDSCGGLDWTAAATVASGTTPTAGDGVFTVGPATVTAVGCYTWQVSVLGTTFPYTASSPAGATDEVTLVEKYAPTLSTQEVHETAGGIETTYDTVAVQGLPAGAPVTDVTWTLYGPVDPVGGTCAGVDWTAAAALDTGSITVTGNGDYQSGLTALPAPGCYSYGVSLPPDAGGAGATEAPGDPTETVHMAPPPTLTTDAADTSTVFGSLTDSVAISGTNGGQGTLTWRLEGPVARAADGTCRGVDWTAAPIVETGTVSVDHDGSVTTGPVPVTATGCYSWVDDLAGDTFPGTASSRAGADHEVTDVDRFGPTLATTAQVDIDAGGVQAARDAITVGGIPAPVGGAAPDPADAVWSLYGPVARQADGACPTAVAAYTGVTPPVAGGALVVTADGDLDTPTTRLAAPGCYSFGVVLTGTADAQPVRQDPGVASETVSAGSPAIVTKASAAELHPGQKVTDTVTIAGTHGGTGTLAWSLVGPVRPEGGSCADRSWPGAPVVAKGSTPISGDGTHTAGTGTVGKPGCYSWTDELTGTGFPSPTALGAGAPGEVVTVTPYQPTLATHADLATSGDTAVLADDITVTDPSLRVEPGSATTLSWQLFGPVAPVDGTCAGVDWDGAAVLASGTIAVAKSDLYVTPATTLPGAGCYTFDETLAPTPYALGATTEPGVDVETVLVAAGSSTSTTTTTAPAGGAGSGSGGTFPYTGLDAIAESGAGLVLVAAGAVLVGLVRRRRARPRSV